MMVDACDQQVPEGRNVDSMRNDMNEQSLWNAGLAIVQEFGKQDRTTKAVDMHHP
jgi:hypothetical protein